ncbi:MAG: hypothetical protein H0S85_00765 [Desulfovibrionaceae bacterium]|jgi:hypothetical protein|nr:hypothetical protein [Desulfovibrionaceae bacterium]
MKARRFALFASITLLLCVCAAGPAQASDPMQPLGPQPPSSQFECGVDIPSGSYLHTCVEGRWTDAQTFTADCESAGRPGMPGPKLRAAIGCGKIMKCQWKLRNTNGNLECEGDAVGVY